MKTLLILRHAKSDHSEPGLADHDRPLNERGKRDAPRVGERLREARLVPDAILSSTARRAKKTADKAAEACKFKGEVQLVPELYLATPATYLSVLSRLDERVERAMIVGHNPGLQVLLAEVTGHDRELPTAALAQVEFDIAAWSELDTRSRGRLIGLWLPRDEE
jgi:phosphohistidine phosphatase